MSLAMLIAMSPIFFLAGVGAAHLYYERRR